MLTSVPTLKVRNTCFTPSATGFCDLSDYDSNGNTGIVYDPNTGELALHQDVTGR